MTAATDHTAGRRSGGQAEGRQEGREERGARMATRLGSGGDKRRGTERNTAGRTGTGREEKKEYVIFKGEKREKRRRDSQKHTSACIYILLNIVA